MLLFTGRWAYNRGGGGGGAYKQQFTVSCRISSHVSVNMFHLSLSVGAFFVFYPPAVPLLVKTYMHDYSMAAASPSSNQRRSE